jgi:hypothetical protein
MTLPGKVIRINSNTTIRLMPTDHLPLRLKRLLQHQQDYNISEHSNLVLPPIEEPAPSPEISQVESKTRMPAITQPLSPRKRKNWSREKENHIHIISPIALKQYQHICAMFDQFTASTMHTIID